MALRRNVATSRSHDELRPLSLEWGGLSRVDGSAQFGFGPTKAVVSVSGPIEVRLNAELPTRAALEVHVRPLSGLPGVSEKRQAKEVREILEQALILTHHPRTLVQVVIQALSPPSPGSTIHTKSPPSSKDHAQLAAYVNATSLAFLNASSIPMKGVLAAVTVGKASKGKRSGSERPSPGFVLDPDEDEIDEGSALCVFLSRAPVQGGGDVYDVIWTSYSGLDEKEFETVMDLAKAGAQKLVQFFRNEVGDAMLRRPKLENEKTMDTS